MSFRITPEDVGRKAVARNGEVYTVRNHDSRLYPYRTEAGTVTKSGRGHESGSDTDYDLIKWADEPDHRPKDLRDEVAIAFVERHTKMATTLKFDEWWKLGYEYADAMMKARGK